MASKKCPKCGEDNPAEAVMCWACYTPLSAAGGASLGATAAMSSGALAQGPMGKAGSGPTPVVDEKEKKPVDPKIFLLLGLMVVGGIVAVVMNMGSGTTEEVVATDPEGTTLEPGNPAPPQQPVAPPPPIANNPGGGTTVTPVKAPYVVKSAPNPAFATGTVGIVANQPALSPRQAAGLAKFAYDQLSRGGKWKEMQIAVFTNDDAAKTFALYQAKRRNQRLDPADLQILASQNVWASAPAFLETRGRGEVVRTPSNNPNSWWSGTR